MSVSRRQTFEDDGTSGIKGKGGRARVDGHSRDENSGACGCDRVALSMMSVFGQMCSRCAHQATLSSS